MAGAFRFARLGSKSLWLDEASSLWIARSSFFSVWHDLSSTHVNTSVFGLYMSLYFAFMHFWVRFGDSEFWLRLPSALSGVATVPLLYALGSRLFSKQAGLAAAILLAVQPVHIAYSQEARSYSLCVFLSVAAFYFFVRAIQEGATGWWVLYVVATVSTVYSHLLAVFLLPAQWLALAFLNRNKAQLKGALVSAMTILLLIVPIIGLAIVKDLGRIPWSTKPSIRDIIHALQTLTGAGVKFPIYLLVLAMAGFSTYQTWRDGRESNQRWPHALLWGWLVLPVASIVLVALWKPPLYPRYLIFSLPASTLLGAVGLCRLGSGTKFRVATMVLGALFVPAIFFYYMKPKEDWRGATAYLLARLRHDDGIVFYQVYGQQPFDYYRERADPASAGQLLHGPFLDSPADEAVHKMPTVWLVLSGLHPQDKAEAALLKQTETSLEIGHQLVSRQRFHEIEILCFSDKTRQIRPEQ